MPNGGTGASTLPVNGVLIGQGTEPIQGTLPGTVSQVLTSNGVGANPTFQDNAAAPPFDDATPITKDDGDPTKLFRIENSGITTATTRVGAVPDRDFTFNQIGYLAANASADLTCTTAYADVTGMTVTLTLTGNYLITANCEIGLTVDANEVLCQLLVNAVVQTGVVRLLMATGTGTDSLAASVTRTWVYANTGSNVAKIQGKKTVNAGTGQVHQVNSCLTAIFLG